MNLHLNCSFFFFFNYYYLFLILDDVNIVRLGCTRVRKKCMWLLLLNVLFLLLASRGSCSFLSGLYLQGKSVSFALTLCCQSIVQFRVSWSAPAPVSALFRIIGNCAWNEQCWKGAFRFLVVLFALWSVWQQFWFGIF